MKYLITGTSRGLGFHLASKLLTYGDVIGISRSIGSAETLLHNQSFTYLEADLSKFDILSKKNMFRETLLKEIEDEEFTVVINAAKFFSNSRRLCAKERQELFQLNLFSVMDLVEALRGLSIKRIFFVNSISGLLGQDSQHEYAASKHALMGYVRSLMKEAKSMPYDIMCINPGGIKTELWNNYPDVDVTSFLNSDELAEIIVKLLLIKQRMFIESMVILPESDL